MVGESQAGGSLLLKRLEQSMVSYQPPLGPPQGPPWAITTLTLVEMSSSVGKEGGGTGTACWELMRKAGGGPSGDGP